MSKRADGMQRAESWREVRHHYHLSPEYLGPEVVLTPRVPSGPAVGEDRTTKRVSVCGDIEDCILAITWVKATGRRFYVYQLADDVDPEDPPRWAVPDSGDTREQWLTEPARFVWTGLVKVPAQEPWDYPDEPPVFEHFDALAAHEAMKGE